MVDQVHAERKEQVGRVEEPARRVREDVPHPPEVPEETEVIARIAGYVISNMNRERPGPDNGHQCKEQHVRCVRPWPLSPLRLMSHAPGFSPRARTRAESAKCRRAPDP